MSVATTARALLQEYKININGTLCDIIEIEMYLRCPDHEDPYVHCAPEQKLQWTWYFHRHSNGTYKNGTFKGVDLTLGDGISYCGVLIRSILSPRDGIICGPCNTVDFILREYKVKTIGELTNNITLNILDNPRGLHITPIASITKAIYHGPRIGLNASKGAAEWHQAFYRYTSHPTSMKKAKRTLKIMEV